MCHKQGRGSGWTLGESHAAACVRCSESAQICRNSSPSHSRARFACHILSPSLATSEVLKSQCLQLLEENSKAGQLISISQHFAAFHSISRHVELGPLASVTGFVKQLLNMLKLCCCIPFPTVPQKQGMAAALDLFRSSWSAYLMQGYS